VERDCEDIADLTRPQIGGSIAGLMCGIALKHKGHTVTVIEKDDNERQSHMAGICLGPDAFVYLAHHDRHTNAFSQRVTCIQALKDDNTLQIFANGHREMTNWNTLYFRLRSAFDGYSSTYHPSPPPSLVTDGSVKYECRKEVLQITRAGDKMALDVLDRNTQDVSSVEADLIIGADGPNSFVRAKYLPKVQRQYVGYIAWRGTVPESEVSPSTCKIFHQSLIIHMRHQHHCVIYMVPGINGSLEPGERFLNLVWYTNETPESVAEIMTDGIDGHRHHNLVPQGHVREDIWKARLEHAKSTSFPEPLLEVLMKIRRPFVHLITEFCSPRAVFEDGKVLIIGDAVSLFRPHTASSTTQAAFHSLMVENFIGGKVSLPEWEEKVLRYARLHSSQSTWWGKCYQNHIAIALLSGLRYWMECGVDKLKSWWNGEKSLLRTSSDVVENFDL
jgi:2-polyprenyl-6-methoxyphenol hydroxylase-like FAD-dependent oxidoreductase